MHTLLFSGSLNRFVKKLECNNLPFSGINVFSAVDRDMTL
jgi:hypothetical protein